MSVTLVENKSSDSLELLDLPSEILAEIFKHVSYSNRSQLEEVCHRFKDIVRELNKTTTRD